MKILIDIGHPAHVHYFKNFIKTMCAEKHRVLVVARNKEVSYELLDSYGIPFVERGKGSSSVVGKLAYLPRANWKILKQALKFTPDIFLSFSSPYAAQVSSMLGKPHIALDDTEHAKLGQVFYRPFTNAILSPQAYKSNSSKKQIKFDGFLELCYLHPNYFSPDPSVPKSLGVKENDKYVVLRFVSWSANHDIGHNGISLENKRYAVREFSKYAKVFISSEASLPDDLKSFHLDIPPHKIHDVLYYASMLYGESATMASEAAMLGTPAIFLDNKGRGYTDELDDKYGLVSNFSESQDDQLKSINKGVDILNTPESEKNYLDKRNKMLSEKIDVTNFLIWFVSEYPDSFHQLKKDHSLQYQFV